MRKRWLVLAVIGGVLLQSCIFYFFRDTDLGGWEFAGPEYLEVEAASNVDILEIGDGTVIVGYSALVNPDSYENGEQAHFVVFDGRRWSEYASSRLLSTVYERIRMGLLDDGRLCFVSESYDGRIEAWDGSAWESISGPSGTDEYLLKATAFSSDGRLFLAFEDGMDEYRIAAIYAYASGAWSLVGDPGGMTHADDLWMEVDEAGRCIVYHSATNVDYEPLLTVYRENGATWEALSAMPDWAGGPSQDSCRNALIFSGSDLYCAVYDHRTEPALPRVLEHTGADWVAVGEPLGLGGSYVYDAGLSRSGVPLVLVRDYDAYGALSAYRLSDETWQLLGIPGFSFGDYPGKGALLSASDGYLYVAYIALGHDSRVSIMRYPLSM